MKPTTPTALLAPFEIWEVPIEKSTIKFHKPLVLQPEWLPPEEPGDRTYLTVDVPELDISSFGVDRDDLKNCIYGDIQFVWQHCVRFNDADLSGSNLVVKHNYLAIAEEVVDG